MPAELTANARRVLEARYLRRDGSGAVIETPDQLFERVARAISEAELLHGTAAAARLWEERFHAMLAALDFLPNSPTLMNAGTPLGQLSACFVLPVEDTMESIFGTLRDMALVQRTGGGCVAADSRVFTTFCGIEPIEVLVSRALADGRSGIRVGSGTAYDVRDLGIRTLSMDPETGESGLRQVTHVWTFNIPPEDQVEITTREGVTVQTSRWHPFMVVRGTELVEVRADGLVPGDIVLGPDRPDGYWPWQECRTVGGLTLDADLGWLIGFTLGDGSFGYVPALRQHRVRWFSGTTDVLNRVQSVLARHRIRVKVADAGRGCYNIATLTQAFVLDLRKACGLMHFGPKNTHIRVPEDITKSPLPVIRAFVAGLLDSDGTVDVDGSPSYSTASPAMADDLAALMGILGYQAGVQRRTPRGRARRDNYTVRLCPLPQVNDLARDLAPYLVSRRRRERLQSSSRKQTALRLPFRVWRDALADLGLARRKGFRSDSGPGPCADELSAWASNGYIGRHRLRRIAVHVATKDMRLARLLSRLADHGQVIARVTRAAVAKPYFDLTVEGWNTYAAGRGGLLMVHNTGFSFSRLRPAGDLITSTGGTASGPLSFMAIYDCATENIKLGGRRRGANMGVLRVDHPDIRAFIDAKRDGSTLRNFNISVGVTDAFMAAVDAGGDIELRHPVDGRTVDRVPARTLFDAICDAAWATGDPGLVFLDTIARGNPVPAAGPIESTNPCISGDALLFTADGLRRAADLAAEGTPVRVVVAARNEPVQASRVFSVGRRPVFRLETIEGYTLRLTADHRVQTTRGWVPAAELRAGDQLCLLPHRAAFGTGGSLALGRVLGWMVGDGTFDRAANSAILRFYHKDRALAHAYAPAVQELVRDLAVKGCRKSSSVGVVHDDRANVSNIDSVRLARLLADHKFTAETKLHVPDAVLTGSEEMQRGFLQGLFTADGHIAGRQTKGVSVRLTSVSLPLLQDVQRMLLAFGIASTIYRNCRTGGPRLLPDGHGGRALYETRPYHDLVISKANLLAFADEIGFLRADKQDTLLRCLAAYKRRLNRESFTARFRSLTPDGEAEVYDLIEPCTRSFVANGFVVHNCGEVPLVPYESCNLGSINLAHLAVERDGAAQVDWPRLRGLVHDAVRFLDDVITVNRYPLEATAVVTQANRKIGLGVMGFAELLILLGISYASDEAVRFAGELMAFIAREARAASAALAEERGVFPNWERSVYAGSGQRVRNATQTSIAPTGTISIIAGTSSSIEPLFALAYRRTALDGETLTEFNPLLVRHLERLGYGDRAVLDAIERVGRLDAVPQVPDQLRRLFVTALEVPPEQHVRIQAAFQQHVDNAVSKTVNLPTEATPADVATAYRLAYRLGCKGVTVFRYGSKPTQVLELGVNETPIEREHFTKCDPGACRL